MFSLSSQRHRGQISLVSLMPAYFTQCLYQARSIGHVQLKQFQISGPVAISDNNARVAKISTRFDNIQDGPARHPMVPAKPFSEKHQIENAAQRAACHSSLLPTENDGRQTNDPKPCDSTSRSTMLHGSQRRKNAAAELAFPCTSDNRSNLQLARSKKPPR
jgi:hypothetical protein